MHMLLDEEILAEATMGSTYTKGCQYYRTGCVRQVHFYSDTNSFDASVLGRENYSVAIQFDEHHEIESYDCDCPAYYSYEGACKHIVAVLKMIQRDWLKYFGIANDIPTTVATQELLAFFQQKGLAAAPLINKTPAKLNPIYAFSVDRSLQKTSWLELTIGNERMYVVKDMPKLLTALATKEKLTYGKNFSLLPNETEFDSRSKTLLAFLQHAYAEEQQREAWSYYNSSISAFSDPRRFRLTDSSLEQLFAALGNEPFSALINSQPIAQVTIYNERPTLNMAVKVIKGGLRLAMDLTDDVLYGLTTDCQYLYNKQNIYKVDPLFASYMKPLLKCFRENKKPEVTIPANLVSEFVSTMLPALEALVAVQVMPTVYQRFYKEPLEKFVYLDKVDSGMSARIEFHYGEVTINPATPSLEENPLMKNKWLLRSTTEENQVINLFRQHNFEWDGDKLIQQDEAATYDFLQQALPELNNLAEVFYADDFKSVKVKPAAKIAAGVRLNTETDMLEFSFDYSETSPQELLELLAAYKLKKRYHRLPDGGFIPLDSPDLQVAAKLIEQLGLRKTDIEKPVIELPKYRALYLDSLAREASDFHMERNSAFKQMVQDIREPQDVEYALPSGIHGKLRDYQKTGFKWLKSLASYGLGGILADDMGLGKTLQVLTLILSEKKTDPTPSLVIAPTSLIFNWQDEVLKFAPELKIAVISGQQNERLEQLKAIDQADLIVTSYGLIKRDIEVYKNMKFKYCFLDEAQHVKNPNTLNAKSVKKITARSYFALTGTPIENTLTELWSIFDFVMPGYLRTHKFFTSNYEIPIVKNGDQAAHQELSRHINPFILRRMKKAVLKELPEKIESKMINEMTAEQTKLYGAWVLQARTTFETEIQAQGFAKSQIKILALLTRLRQICCHPALFIENYQGGSGKLAMLQELLKDALAGGHRILLFSQFTGMLNLIKQELNATQISYHYLDGATKAEERIRLVHSFNAGKKSIFLISLKAGGTGLNLTGADMVIHYDPWWNPAVEDQATDRAYRIGQKNSVQVYKLITKNTIEEKIYALQQKKKAMIDNLIHPGETFLTKMNEAEIRELFTF
jgi:SNF2 family DNA or RNA helicase